VALYIHSKKKKKKKKRKQRKRKKAKSPGKKGENPREKILEKNPGLVKT
jgi:hypothetical protein